MSKYFIVFLLMFCAEYASAMDSDLALRPGEIETISKGELLVQPVPLLVKAVKKNHLLRDKKKLDFHSKPLLKQNKNKKDEKSNLSDEESNLSKVVFNPQNPLKLNETLYSNRLHTLISPRANITTAKFDELLNQAPMLEVVDLSGNKIAVVSEKELRAIANAKHIRMIDLSGNVITSLESSLLKWRKGNHNLLLNLNGNAISPEECQQIQQSIALSPLDSFVAMSRGVLYSGAVGAGALGIGYLTARTIEETGLEKLVYPLVDAYLPLGCYLRYKYSAKAVIQGVSFFAPLRIGLLLDQLTGAELEDQVTSEYAKAMGCSDEMIKSKKQDIKTSIVRSRSYEGWNNPSSERSQTIRNILNTKKVVQFFSVETLHKEIEKFHSDVSKKGMSNSQLETKIEQDSNGASAEKMGSSSFHVLHEEIKKVYDGRPSLRVLNKIMNTIPDTKEEAEKKLQGCEQIYCASYHGTALLVGLGSYFALKKAFQHDYGHYDNGYKSTRILLNDQRSLNFQDQEKVEALSIKDKLLL